MEKVAAELTLECAEGDKSIPPDFRGIAVVARARAAALEPIDDTKQSGHPVPAGHRAKHAS
jgi:hypothetical protein